MKTRIATLGDISALDALYQALTDTALPEPAVIRAVLDHPGTVIWLAGDDTPQAMATLHVLPNVTWGARPYAVIENVVVHSECRGMGFGRAVMQAAIDDARCKNAYKIMLMTGKSASSRGFYEKLGFDADEKWAMTLRDVPIRGSISGKSDQP